MKRICEVTDQGKEPSFVHTMAQASMCARLAGGSKEVAASKVAFKALRLVVPGLSRNDQIQVAERFQREANVCYTDQRQASEPHFIFDRFIAMLPDSMWEKRAEWAAEVEVAKRTLSNVRWPNLERLTFEACEYVDAITKAKASRSAAYAAEEYEEEEAFFAAARRGGGRPLPKSPAPRHANSAPPASQSALKRS